MMSILNYVHFIYKCIQKSNEGNDIKALLNQRSGISTWMESKAESQKLNLEIKRSS